MFTDIEGSTLRWERSPGQMPGALARHDEALTTAFVAHDGHVFKHTGDGILAAFTDPTAAVRAAVDAQRLLNAVDFADVLGLPVRMGIHGGAVHTRNGDYFGPVLNRVSRVMDAGHGGQVVVSADTVYAVEAGVLADGITFDDLGLHRLKGLATPMALAEVRHDRLARTSEPLRTQNTTAGNLTEPNRPLYGREELLAELDAALRLPGPITLLGPGGIGKTVAARHAANSVRQRFPDGVWFCDLSAVRDPGGVVEAVATVLGIVRRNPQALIETLREALSVRTMLVVVDNCEHVVAAAAEVIRAMTDQPSVRVIATSRQPLGLADERRVRVTPLSAPAPAASPATADRAALGTPDRSAPSAAVALFLDRAAAAGHPIAALSDSTDLDAVARICDELDGLPLAIELAAARTSVFTVAEISDRLGQRLRLLRSTVGGEARHQTLGAALDWSYELLGAEAQRLLAMLGAFHGGFDLAAVGVVSGGDEFDTADGMDVLVAQCLVEMGVSSSATRRFRLLETVRQYAVDRLALRPDAPDVVERHSRYFADLVRQAHADWASPAAIAWLQRLFGELANLRQGFGHLVAHDPPSAATMVLALWPLWTSRSMPDEGARWLREVAAALDPAHPLAAHIQDDLASMEWTNGGTAGAEQRCCDAMAQAAAQTVEPRPTVLIRLASICAGSRRQAEALEHVKRAVALHRVGYEPTDKVEVFSAAGAVATLAGDGRLGAQLADEGIAVARSMGPTTLAAALSNEAIALMRQRPLEAQAAARESYEISTRVGSSYGQGNALNALGLAQLTSGDEAAAALTFSESLPPMRDSGQRGGVLNSIDRLVAIMSERLPAGAVTLCASATTIRAQMNDDAAIVERRRADMRTRAARGLSDADFVHAWERGEAISIDQLVDEAQRLTELLEF